MTATTKITPYRTALLVERKDGVDILDKETNKWMTVRNIRSAKWTATVWDRLRNSFQPSPQMQG